MVNKVILIGNVGVDPEVRTLESGAKVARVRLATTERLFDRQANETKEHTEWHTVTLWRGLADVVGALNVLRKGRTGPSAHNKKHIAHVVSVGEQGFRPEDSMPSMGTALEPRDRVVQGIPAL